MPVPRFGGNSPQAPLSACVVNEAIGIGEASNAQEGAVLHRS